MVTFDRRTMKYYHFGQWRNNLQVGQLCATTWNPSLYWATLQSDAAAMTPLFNLRLFKATIQFKKEQIFERIRKMEFPNKPSRQNCMFLCESEAQSREYAAKFGFTLPAYRLFEIECLVFEEHPTDEELDGWHISKDVFAELREPIRHRGNLDFLRCNGYDDSRIEDMARRYWRGENTGNDVLTEVLFRGFYRVIRAIG